MQGVQVPSLVGELRSHMPCGQKSKYKIASIVANSIKTFLNGLYFSFKRRCGIGIKKTRSVEHHKESERTHMFRKENIWYVHRWSKPKLLFTRVSITNHRTRQTSNKWCQGKAHGKRSNCTLILHNVQKINSPQMKTSECWKAIYVKSLEKNLGKYIDEIS